MLRYNTAIQLHSKSILFLRIKFSNEFLEYILKACSVHGKNRKENGNLTARQKCNEFLMLFPRDSKRSVERYYHIANEKVVNWNGQKDLSSSPTRMRETQPLLLV